MRAAVAEGGGREREVGAEPWRSAASCGQSYPQRSASSVPCCSSPGPSISGRPSWRTGRSAGAPAAAGFTWVEAWPQLGLAWPQPRGQRAGGRAEQLCRGSASAWGKLGPVSAEVVGQGRGAAARDLPGGARSPRAVTGEGWKGFVVSVCAARVVGSRDRRQC